MKTFFLFLLLTLSVFGQAQYHIKPSENVVLSNGADYEMRFAFDVGGSIRNFVVPRDAILSVYFDTNTYFTLRIYRGDNGTLIWTGTSTFIPDFYRKHVGIVQTSSNAFTVHEVNVVQPAPEPFVQFNTTPNVWVDNTQLGYPLDVNVVAGGGGSSSLAIGSQLEIFWVGFVLQMGFELAGLGIRFVRNLRASGNVDAS